MPKRKRSLIEVAGDTLIGKWWTRAPALWAAVATTKHKTLVAQDITKDGEDSSAVAHWKDCFYSLATMRRHLLGEKNGTTDHAVNNDGSGAVLTVTTTAAPEHATFLDLNPTISPPPATNDTEEPHPPNTTRPRKSRTKRNAVITRTLSTLCPPSWHPPSLQHLPARQAPFSPPARVTRDGTLVEEEQNGTGTTDRINAANQNNHTQHRNKVTLYRPPQSVSPSATCAVPVIGMTPVSSNRATDRSLPLVSSASESDSTTTDDDSDTSCFPSCLFTLPDSSNKVSVTPILDIQRRNEPLYNLEEFKLMWESCAELAFGGTTEDIEDGPFVRGSNKKLSCSDCSTVQDKAQYGRLLPDKVDFIFDNILNLNLEDVFVDIGHGIGNTVLQAALTRGCRDSRGIELVYDRNWIALQFQLDLQDQVTIHQTRHGRNSQVGPVHFCHGRLEDAVHRDFLTKCDDHDSSSTSGGGSMKVLLNNFNSVFADRCANRGAKYYLDNFVAGLFALMKPGSVLLTLHPLDMPPSLQQATDMRTKHGLPVNEHVSFYKYEQVIIGKANETVSWSQDGSNQADIIGHRYERTSQPSGNNNNATILCCNPHCQAARDCIPIPATKSVMIGDDTECIVMNSCSTCNVTLPSTRQCKKRTTR